jgi:hypothetical protein
MYTKKGGKAIIGPTGAALSADGIAMSVAGRQHDRLFGNLQQLLSLIVGHSPTVIALAQNEALFLDCIKYK